MGLIDNPNTNALTALFGLYLLSILVFALVYWRIYSRDPSAFAFNADILRRQSLDFETSATKKLADDRQALALLRAAAEHIAAHGPEKPEESSKWYELGGRQVATLGKVRFTANKIIHSMPMLGPFHAGYHVIVEDDVGNRFTHAFETTDSKDIPKLVGMWIKSLERKVETTSQRLSSIGTEKPEVWSFPNFLYFSVISQTTVGYGDILPNSTKVRMLVSAQVLISSLLLVVVINLILS